jgi:hypothetical protein
MLNSKRLTVRAARYSIRAATFAVILGVLPAAACMRAPEPGPSKEEIWKQVYIARLEALRALDQAFNALGRDRRDDGGAAEADVVLEGDLRALDLALVGLAAQLPVELGALREAGGAEGVALGDEAARGVDDPLAAVGDGAGVDELAALAFGARPSAS